MSQKRIFVLIPSPADSERISSLAARCGTANSISSPEEVHGLLEPGDLAVLVVDGGLARYGGWKGILPASAGLVVTGPDAKDLRKAAEEWPSEYYVDTFLLPPEADWDRVFLRVLERALEHLRLRAEAAQLRRSLDIQESKVREIYAEIQDIKDLLNANFLKEIEKRIAIEAKYVWFQKERQRIEAILRKIYAADDVSSLLDIVPDLRDIVQASSATVYIIEENEVLGRYLKPLVWDNAFLAHSEFSKFVALLDAQDFAASVARYGHEVNVTELTFDKRLSKRYIEFLKTPLKSLLGVPIMHDRKVIGVVEVYNKLPSPKPGPGGFSRQDQQVLQSLSEHMAIAMTKLNLIQYDALTSLLRPEPFFDRVLQKVNALSKRRREEGSMALVMGDVDWFKAYNDRNGHEAGNRLLRELAHVLRLAIREEDLLCRYGGEEFLFFLKGVKSLEEAAHLTDRIRKNVEDHYFEFQEFQPQNNLTMSFGVTVFPKNRSEPGAPLSKTDLKRLAGEADLALAEAKGKRRPDLRHREAGETAAAKNRVSSYRWDEDAGGEKKKPEPRPGGERFYREKRKYERYNASTTLMFRENGGLKVTKTVNVSLEGARIISDARLPQAQTMDTVLVLEDRGCSFKSDVIYSEMAEGEPTLYYSGLKFRDLTYREIKNLETYLFHFRRRDSTGL